MTAAEFSLVAVTIAFIGLVLWVYSPSRRGRIESYGSMPLDDDEHSVPQKGQKGERS